MEVVGKEPQKPRKFQGPHGPGKLPRVGTNGCMEDMLFDQLLPIKVPYELHK